MEKAQLSQPSDVPESIDPEDLPIKKDLLKKNKKSKVNVLDENKINLNTATLTDIMTLHGMEEELALEIQDYLEDNIVTDSSDLLELESIDEQILKVWDEKLDDMRIDINEANEDTLKKIKGIGSKLAKIILKFRDKLNGFTTLDQLKDIDGIGKNKLAQLKSRLKIGE